MGNWVDPFIGWLAAVFQPGTAFALALGILAIALMLCIWQWLRMRGLNHALNELNVALNPVRSAADDSAAHAALQSNYQTITRVAQDGADPALRRAWAEFEESIIDLQSPVLNNSVRPDEFFHSVGDRSRGLLWWANIAVAVGLVLTFLGIIAALGTTSAALGRADDSGAMQVALKTLLSVTAAKFMTSAAGVLASIILRAWDLHLQRRTRDALDRFVDALERGLCYLPPQRIAADQLRQLEQIATAQTKFATELATAIGDKFNEKISPMVTVLGEINGSIASLKDDMVGGLSDKVGEALGNSAGKEMQAMALALTAMTERLTSIPERLSASAGDANTRIEAAAQLFSQASAGMSVAFDALGSKIEAMGDAVVAKQRDAFDGFTGQVRDASAAYGEAATESAAAVSSAGVEIKALIGQVGDTLAAISGQLATQASASGEAARQAAELTRRAMADGSREAGEEFARVAAGMTATFDALGAKIDAMGDAVLARQRETFDGFSGQVRDAGAAYGEAAAGSAAAVASAGVEIKALVEQVGATLAAIGGQLSAQAAAESEATRRATGLARDAMAEATREAGELFAQAAAAGARNASQLSAEMLEQAFETFAHRFEVAGRRLTDDIDTSAGRIQTFGSSLERVSQRSDAQVDKLAAAGVSAERLGGLLSGAASEATGLLSKASLELANAATPVREASEAIADGIEELAEALTAQREAISAQAAESRTMAAQLEATATAAQRAWKSYEDRFDQVDQSLGKALEQVTQAASESAEQLNRYAKQVDDNLGSAVNRLTSVVDGLADLPEAIERATQMAQAA